MTTPPFFDAHALLALHRVSAAVAHPHEPWAVVAAQRVGGEHDERLVGDLWRISLDEDTPPVCLTPGTTHDHSPCFDACGHLVFLSDRASSKDDAKGPQAFRFGPHPGDPQQLTHEPLGVGSIQCSINHDVMMVTTQVYPGVPHAEQAAYAKALKQGARTSAMLYTRAPVRHWDHWESKSTTHAVVYRAGERKDITPELTRMSVSAHLSPDGSTALLLFLGDASEYAPLGRTGLLLDTTSGEVVYTLDDEATNIGGVAFDPHNNRLAYTVHQLDPHAHGAPALRIWDLNTHTHSSPALPPHELWLTPVGWDPQGRLWATSPTQDTVSLFAIDLERLDVSLCETPQGTVHHTSMRHDRCLGTFSSLTQPPRAFFVHTRDLKGSALADINPALDLPKIIVERHRALGPQGEDCPYIVVRAAEVDGPQPGLVWIHGGPVSHHQDAWHWRWHAVSAVAQGYVVALPNPKGSTGYGQAHVEGIWGNVWGDGCYRDLMVATDEFCARSDVDADHVVAMGGSFGGYMTNWIGTQTDRFCCLVTHAGLTDLRTFQGVTDHPRWWAHALEVDIQKSPSSLDRYSPSSHLASWRSPVLIIHGQQDYRVPVGEALILFDRLDAQNIKASLLIYPDENHWITKPQNILSWYNHVWQFMAPYTQATPQ